MCRLTGRPQLKAIPQQVRQGRVRRLQEYLISAEKFRWKTERQIDRVADLFDDDLIFVHLNGHITSKRNWIAQLRSGRFIYHVIEVKKVSAKVYGETAVLVGKAEFTVGMGDGRSKYPLVYTEVYTRRDGFWKLVNLHTCAY